MMEGGAEGGEGGAEGKGNDDEAVVYSAEYLEVAAMATEPAFDVNTSRCSDGNPLFCLLWERAARRPPRTRTASPSCSRSQAST